MATILSNEAMGLDAPILPHDGEFAQSRPLFDDCFTSAFRHAAIGMALVLPQGRFLEVNRALCELLGYSAAELTSFDFQSLTHPDDLEGDLSLVQQLLQRSIESFRIQKRYRNKDGRWIWTSLSVSLICDTQNQPLYFISQIQDISKRKQIELELEERKREIQTLLDNLPDVIIRYDRELRVIFLNRAAEAVFELPVARLLGKKLLETGLPAAMRRVNTRCALQVFETRQSATDHYEDSMPHASADGTSLTRHFQVRMVPETDAKGEVVSVLAVARDITQLTESQIRLAQANRELRKLAHIDGLTGLQNRRSFDGRLQEEIVRAQRSGERFSLAIMDIDHFKAFNDNFGHVAGDDTLRTVAAILAKTLRPVDIIARYGGEEFTMILPATTVEGGICAAERCRHAMDEGVWPQIPVTGSFGVATWNGEDAQTLLVKADVALYTAKKQGRNRVQHANSVREK